MTLPRSRVSTPITDEDDRRKAMLLVPVSRETEERLATYVALLRQWQRIKNLVGPSTLETIWSRHIADSAQLVRLEPQARRWVDLGSGAGFPGLVIALVLHGRPGLMVDLVESNERKCAFLREAVRATGAAARVHMGRIEDVLPALVGQVDVVTSRALAGVPNLLAMSHNFLQAGAVGLFLTGSDSDIAEHAAESDRTSDKRFDMDAVPSLTHPNGRIIRVRHRFARPASELSVEQGQMGDTHP